MARKPKFQVRRVGTREDRQRPSIYQRLKTDESFSGYALFEPDPEAEDNPGYYEFFSHWDNAARTRVPCAGDACPFCAANQLPSARAIGAFYMPDNDKREQIKLFEMNASTTQLLDDEAEDEEGIRGKKIRIKRLDDDGTHNVKVRHGVDNKPLTKAELKKAMALLEETVDIPDSVEKKLMRELERMRAQDALEDDDDDDDDDDEEDTPSPKGKRTGKAKPKSEDEDEDDDESEDEDEDEDENDEDDDEDDEEDEDEDEDDEEEDEEDEEEDEDEEDEEDDDEEEEDEEVEEISGTFIVSKIADEEGGVFHAKDKDGTSYKFFAGEDVEIDFDVVKKGVDVKIEAEQDDEGDWIATSVATTRKRVARKK